MSSTPEKLRSLRSLIKKNNINVYIIPLSDPNLGEYIPDHWNIIKWLTGFSGSAATVVITESFAGLWTDSRYFSQAEKQLAGSGFEFVKPKSFQRNDYIDYIGENIRQGATLAFDGRIFPISRFMILEKRLQKKKVLINSNCDLIDGLWSDRPALPFSVAFDHPLEFCGKGRSDKIAEVRELMRSKDIDYQLLTSPDDIMWLLNIRGNDLEFSPLLLSFALVGKEEILLFIDEIKIPHELAGEFDRLGIHIFPLEKTEAVISSVTEGLSVMLNPLTTSVSIYNSLSKISYITEDSSIPSRLKAIKNKTEIANIGEVMVNEGVVLTKFFYWLENNLGKVPLYESHLADKIMELRSGQEGFLGSSFATISAFGANSALPHYVPEEEPGDMIGERGILLIDTGGQYMGGTTDITRTMTIGIPEAGQKRDFTLILKGFINLALTKFPYGTKGYQLDILARRAMWESGMNYSHGTGHGVGFCLNVHEGPQSISPGDNKTIFEPGMLTSIEPAIYREGEYGIRTENLVLCFGDEETEFGYFLKFETVSLCYIDKHLIDRSLLNDQEIEWLNRYHSEVYERLSSYLEVEEKKWLKEKTDPV